MKLEIGFGSCPQTVELPDETVLDVLYPNGIEAPADSAAEVARALLSPIGTPPLAELAKGKQKVAIVTSDITRPMPSAVVLPLVLDELYRAGVRPESVLSLIHIWATRRIPSRISARKFWPQDMRSAATAMCTRTPRNPPTSRRPRCFRWRLSPWISWALPSR